MGAVQAHLQPEVGPYELRAAQYCAHGVRPFPVDEKVPHVTHYAGKRPGVVTLEKWVKNFPAANLGLPTRREGLVVLDADDADAVLLFEALGISTPLRVKTRRGEHWYFKNDGNEFAGVCRPGGRKLDIKAAGSADYVLLPGSVHDGVMHRLLDCDDEDMVAEFARRLRFLPPLDRAVYDQLVEKPSSAVAVRGRGIVARSRRCHSEGCYPRGSAIGGSFALAVEMFSPFTTGVAVMQAFQRPSPATCML